MGPSPHSPRSHSALQATAISAASKPRPTRRAVGRPSRRAHGTSGRVKLRQPPLQAHTSLALVAPHASAARAVSQPKQT
eukprot:260352-Chlamydomonas_euryale.AAC.1